MITKTWGWIKSQFEPKADPQLEALVIWYAEQTAQAISKERSKFSFSCTMSNLGVESDLHEFVADRTYRYFLRRAWNDGNITDEESKTLRWLAGALEISTERANEINDYTAIIIFKKLFSRATEDRVIDDKELRQLGQVASALSTNLPELLSRVALDDGEAFIEMLADAVSVSGKVSIEHWDQVLVMANRLGLHKHEFLRICQPAAKQLVERVFDRLISDGTLGDDEQSNIESLVQLFELDESIFNDFRAITSRRKIRSELLDLDVQGLAAVLNDADRRDRFTLSYRNTVPLTNSFSNTVVQSSWWLVHSEQAANWKYSGGATQTIDRRSAHSARGLPSQLASDLKYSYVSSKDLWLYFLPPGILIRTNGIFHGISYDDLELDTTRVILSNPPRQCKIVDHTWTYVNKSGGPDGRFKENPRIPVCEFSAIVLPELSLELQCSSLDIINQLQI